MKQRSEPTFLVLHASRVRGFAATPAVAETAALEQLSHVYTAFESCNEQFKR